VRERNLKPDIGWIVGQVRDAREMLERVEGELRALKRCGHCKGEAYSVRQECNCDEGEK
jgi:hypothetical protein